jgi:hypothetical protein
MDLSGNAALLFRDRQDEKTLVLQTGTGVTNDRVVSIVRQLRLTSAPRGLFAPRSLGKLTQAAHGTPASQSPSSPTALGLPYRALSWKPQKEAALALWFEVAAQLHRGTRSPGSGPGPPPRTGLRRAISGVLIEMPERHREVVTETSPMTHAHLRPSRPISAAPHFPNCS